jgi:hypothetical protein
MNNLPNGQPITSSFISIKQTNTPRSCFKHRPDGSYQRKNNSQLNRLPKDNRTRRLSTGGNISGRVSFAHAALSNGKILQESTSTFQPEIDLTEEKLYFLTKGVKEFQLI